VYATVKRHFKSFDKGSHFREGKQHLGVIASNALKHLHLLADSLAAALNLSGGAAIAGKCGLQGVNSTREFHRLRASALLTNEAFRERCGGLLLLLRWQRLLLELGTGIDGGGNALAQHG
jgi:hypothetical protein